MPSLWIAALKEFNLGKDSWCVPRKGSKDNDKVRRMMKGEAASAVKKPVEKKEIATSPMKAETPKAKTPPAPKAKTPPAPKAKAKKSKTLTFHDYKLEGVALDYPEYMEKNKELEEEFEAMIKMITGTRKPEKGLQKDYDAIQEKVSKTRLDWMIANGHAAYPWYPGAWQPDKAVNPKPKAPEPKAKTPEPKAKPVKVKKVKVVEPKKEEPKKEEGEIDNTVDASKLPAIANKGLISQKVSGAQDVVGDYIIMGEKTHWFLPAGDKFGGWYGSMDMTKIGYKKWSHIFTLELKDGVIKGLPELITKLKADKKLMASSDEYGKNAELEDICRDESTFSNMFEDKPAQRMMPDLYFDLPRLTGFDKDDNFDTKWYEWDNYEIVKVERKGEMRESKFSGLPDTFLNGSVTIGLSKFPDDDDSGLWEWMWMSRNAPAKTDNDKYLKSFEDHVAKTKKYRVKKHAEGKYSEKK